jgi:acetoacetyl-CoA synthetase
MDKTEKILWQPTQAEIDASVLTQYKHWLQENKNLVFDDYEALWHWSVSQPEEFWASLISFFDVKLYTPYTRVLSGGQMPEHIWFEGAQVNYAGQIAAAMHGDRMAIHFINERGDHRKVSADEMWREVARIREYLIRHQVKAGDRVAGYLPNIPEATYAFLACASIGAVWSCCSPDFGVSSVIDRFAQIEPVIFISADGYHYNGKVHSRLENTSLIMKSLPVLRDTLLVRYTGENPESIAGQTTWYEDLPESSNLVPDFKPVPFEHPLWILYSSGTTGAPKAITHSHGGCLLEHLKYLAFHNDVHHGENFFWYSTTGWMMWNFLQGSMLLGATIVLYDGSPGYPDLNGLWKLAAEIPIHHFGTSAPFLVACMREGISPGEHFDLHALRSIGSTGSPLPPEAFDWVYEHIHDRIWLCSMSGGTDVCTAFVGGVLEKPVVSGEIQARGLGCALFAFNDEGQPVTGVVGEMVITQPMPSMPVYFWNDPDKAKYRASYFEDFPGVWRHGDWVEITSRGGVIIYGRSDATLNRQGVRIGTAEIYRVLNDIAAIDDGLIVNLELEGGRHYMPLFVKLREGKQLDEALQKEINSALRSKCSPRHVPDEIIIVPDIPYTISGKKMEAPVKKILLGMKMESTLNRDAMRNPESLEFFREFKIPGRV